MSLSTSRQQFLAYEPQAEQDIHYSRKGGIFISTCICICFVIFALLIAILVGIIVYYVTYHEVTMQSEDFWNEAEPFSHIGDPSPDLRLPSYVVPSFYRLKITADLESSVFSGDVFITISASKHTKEIILHSKNLTINPIVKLTEQIYEKFDTLQLPERTRGVFRKKKRNVSSNENNATEAPSDVIMVDNRANTSSNSTEETRRDAPVEKASASVITEVTHSNVRNIKITQKEFSTGDRMILYLASPLTPNVNYTLHISFGGDIYNSLTGFYKSTYMEGNEEKYVGVTQFEPTSARAAFPCFDEPAFKAKFEISIAHKENVTVLSNMKVASQEPIESSPGWLWTHFAPSVKMSTYLVAYVLSEFQHLESSYLSKDNVTKPIRVWARSSFIKNAQFALSIIPKLLSFYENVFGLPYALDKIDLVAIPDFSNGAMENWGLITFRETSLLFDDKEGLPRERQIVAIDVAHELAHQWFGNYVTMKWWTDLWLNEGFATYMEYIGVNHIAPEWDMLQSLSKDKMILLISDSLKNTSPVSRKVVDASEISQKFDEISYTKGANLIRMLNHTITYDHFHKGLVIYLNRWKYQNAEENDLWNAMSEALQDDSSLKDLSVTQFMNTWTRQPGYPLVYVHRDYDTGYVTFQQVLFTSAGSKNRDQLWRIPISYTTTDTPAGNWSTRPKLWLTKRSVSVKLPVNATQALYVNVDAIGYYRVNYDQRNWDLLIEAVKSNNIKSPITKAQLIDDAFNLAKAGHLNYNYALGLTTFVINGEDSRTVWDLLLDNIYFLKENLRATSGYIYFQDYMRLILKKQLERVNYGLKTPKDDNEALLMENLVTWECLVESPRCLQWAREEFERIIQAPHQNTSTIPNFLRSIVLNMALRHGGRREFDLVWEIYLNNSDPSIKQMAASNLPSTREESLITLLLEKSITELPNQIAITVWAVEPPVGTRIAQDFLIENFDRVYERFTNLDSFMFPNTVNSAFGAMTTAEELDKFKKFALQHKEKLMPMSQVLAKIVDGATLRIGWIKNYAAGISEWFKNYVQSNTAMTHTDTTTVSTLTENITTDTTDNVSTTSSP